MKQTITISAEDCPFMCAEGEEPAPIIHPAIGVCVHCFDVAHVLDANNRPACWACAYHSAN